MSVDRTKLIGLLRDVLALVWAIGDRADDQDTDIVEAAADIEPVASDLLEALEGQGPKPSEN